MENNKRLSPDINHNIKILKDALPIKRSFDVIGRDLIIGQSTNAYLVFIDGFAKDDIMLWILEVLQS
ncbi:MAG: spore germination protein, partial [Clostridiales bacterium]|nr:spore germination protein [Clostridiales bacterium]